MYLHARQCEHRRNILFELLTKPPSPAFPLPQRPRGYLGTRALFQGEAHQRSEAKHDRLCSLVQRAGKSGAGTQVVGLELTLVCLHSIHFILFYRLIHSIIHFYQTDRVQVPTYAPCHDTHSSSFRNNLVLNEPRVYLKIPWERRHPS